MRKYIPNVEALAKDFDKKRGLDQSELEEIMGYIFQYGRIEGWILDVGCGTGRFLIPLSKRTEAQFVGLDTSLTMLKQVKKKIHELSLTDKCHIILADGQLLPIKPAVFSFIIAVQILHYFKNIKAAMDEISRVVSENSTVLVLSCSHDQIRGTLDVVYFPSLAEIDTARVPDLPAIKNLFNRRGFQLKSTIEVVRRISVSSVKELIMKVQEKPYSSYTLFTDEDFQRRLKKFEKNLLERYGAGELSYLIPSTMMFFERI